MKRSRRPTSANKYAPSKERRIVCGALFACAESAVSETVKKYGAYLNAVAYNILRSRACDRLDHVTAKCRST